MLKKDEKLRFLSFRLDFNEFYLSKRGHVDMDDFKILDSMGINNNKNYMFYDKTMQQQAQQN